MTAARQRRSLLENNRALWRQTEERKQLNAAFSHDLRNPLTVLKGSVKLAEQCASAGELRQEELCQHLARIRSYTNRIAQYVEAMSGVQRLEQVRIVRSESVLSDVAAGLEAALRLAAADNKKQLLFRFANAADTSALSVFLDKNALLQAAENLVSNALRFARRTVWVTLSLKGELLMLMVDDDGGGFSGAMLEKGVQPFQKDGGDPEHLGMGLYSAMLLCRKHGGFLRIGNGEAGAVVCAAFKVSGEAGSE